MFGRSTGPWQVCVRRCGEAVAAGQALCPPPPFRRSFRSLCARPSPSSPVSPSSDPHPQSLLSSFPVTDPVGLSPSACREAPFLSFSSVALTLQTWTVSLRGGRTPRACNERTQVCSRAILCPRTQRAPPTL